MRCPDYLAKVEHPTHWHTVRAGNITVAGGQCPGWPDKAPPTSISITVHPQPDRVGEVHRAIAADPCRVLGHRPAWLNSGGMACGVCGAPL